MNYREHRGGFGDSMATRRPFTTMSELIDRVTTGTTGTDLNSSITITRYSFDSRLDAECFIVTTAQGVAGFIDDGK